MAKAFVKQEEFDALDPALQGEYTKKGDGFELKVEAVNGLALVNAAGLQSALKKERDTVKTLTDKVAAYSVFEGLDIETTTKAIEQYRELESHGGLDASSKAKLAALEKTLKDDVAKQVKAIEAKHQGTVAELQKKIDATTGQLKDTLVVSSIKSAITAAKGREKLLLPAIVGKVRMVEENGRFVTRVVDDNGDPRTSLRDGTPLTIQQLVDELKGDEDFAHAFEGTEARGSGASGGGGGGGGGGKNHVLTADQARDPAAYRQAKAEAAKSGKPLTIAG